MKAKAGNRTARISVRIVENPKNITLFFDEHDLPPIIVNAKTGQTGRKAHGKLKRLLDEVETKGQAKTAGKAAAKAVTEAVKTVSKDAVKAVTQRASKDGAKQP